MLKKEGWRYYKEEDKNHLFGLITDLDYAWTIDKDLWKKRIRWNNRLIRLRYTLENKTFNEYYEPYEIGEKVIGDFKIGENDFYKILDILHNEIKDIIIQFNHKEEIIKGTYFQNFKTCTFTNINKKLFSKPVQCLKITQNYIQTMTFKKPFVKYKIDIDNNIKFI